MAYIEFNALSVILCGSFSAKVFLPEMKKMYLDDEKHEKKYPVLWLLHSEGGSALDWVKSSAERCMPLCVACLTGSSRGRRCCSSRRM